MTLLYSGLLMGFITPGRVGELYPLFRLQKEGYPKTKGLFSIVLVRIFDFCLLLVNGMIAVYFVVVFDEFDTSVIKVVLWIALLFVVVFLGGFFLYKDHTAKILQIFSKKSIQAGYF